jgi:hypothetical protein
MFVVLKEIHEMRLMCDHEADLVLDSDLKIRPPTDLPVAVISWRYVAYLRNGKNILPPRSLKTVRFWCVHQVVGSATYYTLCIVDVLRQIF